MSAPERRQMAAAFAVMCLLLLGAVAVYASSLDFGFIWDDPVWYGHARGKTWWQTLLPTTAFQFYRPLSMWYVWLFMRADGTFAVMWLHAFQIGYHLLNTLLAYGVSRRLGLARGTAVTVAALFAFYPFLYQAVAWAAPNQPMASALQNSALLVYLAARPLPTVATPPTGRRFALLYGGSLVLYLLALMVQESSMAAAVVPWLYEVIVRQEKGRGVANRLWQWRWALAFPALAAVYLAVWLQVPRQLGLTSAYVDGRNLLYLLQGFIHPLLARPDGYAANGEIAAVVLVLLFWGAAAGLLALAAWRGRGRVALLALAWAMTSTLPLAVGLEFDYVSLAARLFYAPALGIGLLWGAALWPRISEQLSLRVASVALICFLLIQNARLLRHFEQVWQAGTDHLRQAVTVLAETDHERVLFINFPDRFTWKWEPFPVGYWGLTLTPVVVKLADFPPTLMGKEAGSLSRSMPWVGQAARESGPYWVDMRGIIIQPDELVTLATEDTVVYLSDYLPDGRFQLWRAGHLLPGAAPACTMARFGEAVCLHQATWRETAAGCGVTLVWSTAAPLPPHVTIFAHVGAPGQPPLAQADGDTWRGTLPLANWPLNTLIVDERTLPCLAAPEGTAVPSGTVVQIGVYDWVEGTRLPGIMVDGARPLPDNAWRLEQ